jgi:DNA-binding IclR family transcriptional regulator
LNLTAITAVLKGPEVVVIETAEPGATWAGGQWVGRHVDAHCTSLGKALIAYLSDAELEAMFRCRPLARFTRNTICSIEALKAHLVRVRTDGFAVNDEEHITGVRGVAAPIVNHVGKVIAAIGVNGSQTEMPRSQLLTAAKEVVFAAREISRRLLDPLPLEI